MVRQNLVALLLAARTLPVAGVEVSGADLHCVGGRAHVLSYRIEGEPRGELAASAPGAGAFDGVRNALLSFEPAPERAEECNQQLRVEPSGDKEVCYGANQDATCARSKEDLPLEGSLTCSGCFVGAAADIYYKLNYSALELHSIEVGLHDIHVRGGLAVRAQESASKTFQGSKVLGAGSKVVLIDQLVGCPVCVRAKIAVGAPTTLNYELDLHAKADVTVGVDLDVNLGDSAMRWDRTTGWTQIKTPRTLTINPVLVASGSSAEADLTLGMNASLQVDIDDIVWYHMNLLPTVPAQCTLHALHGGPARAPKALPRATSEAAEICLDAGIDFKLEHEADLHWNFLTWKENHHWGPTLDYEWSKKGAAHACQPIAQEEKPGHHHSDFYA